MRTRDWKDKSAYTYGLHGTPSTFTLEERIATLEHGQYCVLLPSGLAAVACASLALLKSGDEVLVPDNAYGPNKALTEGELAAWGITHQYYDPMSVADLAARINERTRLVWLEAAGSITLEFPDLIEQVRLCRARGVTCVLDNTWGAGLAFNPFDLDGQGLGVHVSVHALTKYPSGGGDVLMGSVSTRDEALHRRILLTHMRLGFGVSAGDTETLLRALPSIALRYHAQDQAARQLARWCAQQPAFAQVLHPALTGSPGHAHWQQVCGAADALGGGAAAGLFSVMVHERYSQAQVDAFATACACSGWATAGAGRSAWSCPTTWPPSAPTAGRRTWRVARWCAFPPAWRRWPTCRPTWRRPWREPWADASSGESNTERRGRKENAKDAKINEPVDTHQSTVNVRAADFWCFFAVATASAPGQVQYRGLMVVSQSNSRFVVDLAFWMLLVAGNLLRHRTICDFRAFHLKARLRTSSWRPNWTTLHRMRTGCCR
jgi:cystathionine beta-lyase